MNVEADKDREILQPERDGSTECCAAEGEKKSGTKSFLLTFNSRFNIS